MYVPFEKMPWESRVWVYQANRKISPQEQEIIQNKLEKFLDQWTAHNQGLKAAGKLFHQQFLVLAVDEYFSSASGCSIDSSVHFVQELETELGINFFDKSKVAFLHQDQVFLESLPNLKQRIEKGEIKENTITFNNLITNKKELEESWTVPVKDSWLNKYF